MDVVSYWARHLVLESRVGALSLVAPIEFGTFGDVLRGFRLAAGLTQEGLAERSGLSWRGISDLERGVRHVPHRETLRRLLEGLDLHDADRQVVMLAAARQPQNHQRPPLSSRTDAFPEPLTPLIGRTAEVEIAVSLLGSKRVRLLTITGPGGVGKTRVAIEVGRRLTGIIEHGVVFVPLAHVSHGGLLMPIVGEKLGLVSIDQQLQSSDAPDQLGGRWMLLILDSFEHLVDASTLVSDLLARCPKLFVLVTSREPLHLSGEHELVVPPLSVPDGSTPVAALSHFHSVELFCDRAVGVDRHFELTAENGAAVAEICAKLDGLPLAIELAAAQTKVLSPRAILDRLGDRLALLTNGARDLPARQQSLRATIAWSYDRLTPEEQCLFRQAAVLTGGFGIEALQAVHSAAGDGETFLRLLTSLVDKSLLFTLSNNGEARFSMLNTIREFALDRLQAAGELEQTNRRLMVYIWKLAQVAERELAGRESIGWYRRLDDEIGNIRAALDWALANRDSDAGVAILSGLLPWMTTGIISSEGCAWAQGFLELDAEGPLRGPASFLLGAFRCAVGDFAGASANMADSIVFSRAAADSRFLAYALMWSARFLESESIAAYSSALESATLFRELHDDFGLASALMLLGRYADNATNDPMAASRYLDESEMLFRSVGHGPGLARALTSRGLAAMQAGDALQAHEFYTEALSVSRASGDTRDIAKTLALHGYCLQKTRIGNAIESFREALVLSRNAGDRLTIILCLEGLAGEARSRSRYPEAIRLFAAAASLRNVNGVRVRSPERRLNSIRAEVAESAFAEAWKAGQALDLGDVVRLALDEPAVVSQADFPDRE